MTASPVKADIIASQNYLTRAIKARTKVFASYVLLNRKTKENKVYSELI
jgi:hypothetical protein